MGQRTQWMPVAVTSAVAGLLVCAAVVTADQAACDDPGSYVLAPGGVQLVGGCLHSEDVPVGPPPGQQFPRPLAEPLGD